MKIALESDQYYRFYADDGSYRYGMNGQEKDLEWLGGALSYKYRVEDARLGRFLSIDPLASKYPSLSTYQFCSNTPIYAIELEGKEASKDPNTNAPTPPTPNNGTGNANTVVNNAEANANQADNLGPEKVGSTGTYNPGPRYDGCIGAYRPPSAAYSYSNTTTSVDVTLGTGFIAEHMADNAGFTPYVERVVETQTTVVGAYSADGKTFTETVTIVRTSADVSVDNVTEIHQTTVVSTKTYNVVGEAGKQQTFNGKSVLGPVLVYTGDKGSSSTNYDGNTFNVSAAFTERLNRSLTYNVFAQKANMGAIQRGIDNQQQQSDQLLEMMKGGQ